MNKKLYVILILTLVTLFSVLFPQVVFASDVGDASENGIIPILIQGNPKCGDPCIGCSNTGFKPQPEPPTTGTYTFSDDTNTVQITSDGTHFDWSSTVGICTVIVKGGPKANIYNYDDVSFGDGGLHAPINSKNGKLYDISHIEFCYSEPTDPVPEATTIILMGFGLTVLGSFAWHAG